ncbi:MAG: SurA N-terminal domain-containing protein [Pseudomonadota bacterium]
MLTLFRNAMNGPFKWVFILLLVAAFGVVGVPALNNFGKTAAITVGKEKISARDIEIELRDQMDLIRLENPELTRDQALAAGLGDQVINTLTLQALIEQEADNLGIVAPLPVVQEYIERLPAFRDPETGKFDAQRVGLVMQSRGLDANGLADSISETLTREQIVSVLTEGGDAPEELTRLLLLRQSEERDIRYTSLTLDAEDYGGEPSEEDIAAYYELNISSYQTPEYRAFTVVLATPEELGKDIPVAEEEVRQAFDARAGATAAQETRSIRQVRVRPDQLDAVSLSLENGGDFDAVVAAVGARVTTLDNQQRSDFIVEELGDAVFAAQEGELVGPVETAFGALVAEVVSVTVPEPLKFDDLKAELEAELRSEAAVDRVLDVIDVLEIARDEGASLEDAAAEAGLTVEKTDPVDSQLFTANGIITDIPSALAREGRRLDEGEESEALPIGDGYGFIAVDRIVPPAPQPFEDVRTGIIEALAEERRAAAADLLATRFESLIDEGKSFEEAATELGGEAGVATLKLSMPEKPVSDAAADQAFELQVSERAVVPLSGDDMKAEIVEVTAIRFGDQTATQEIIPLVAQQFGQQLGCELQEAYLAALRESSEVLQNPREVARGLGQDLP